ncbi:MAG: zinc ABC transporter substrate-binding protein, partial [Actinomyces massiliensis]
MRPMFICGRRTMAVLASLVLVAAALPLTACGASTTSTDDSAIKAVASTTQICDYITQLASDGQDDGLSFDRTGAEVLGGAVGADTAGAKTHLTLTCLL